MELVMGDVRGKFVRLEWCCGGYVKFQSGKGKSHAGESLYSRTNVQVLVLSSGLKSLSSNFKSPNVKSVTISLKITWTTS